MDLDEGRYYKVFNTQDIYVPSVNGILDGDMMNLEISKFFKQTTEEFADELVDITTNFPEQDFTKVTMRTDCYLIPKKYFDALMDKIYK